MIINIRKILIALIAAVFAIPAVTQTRAQGLPGEHLITDRWRSVYSMYSGVTNPAFINEENYIAMRILFANTLEIFDSWEAGVTMPLGLYDAVGATWMRSGTTLYGVTDASGNPTGSNLVDQNQFIALSYARNVWKGLTVGGNLNIIARSVPADITGHVTNVTTFGYGMDVGLTYKVLRHRQLGTHTLGVSTNNLVNVISDTDEKYASALRFSLLSDFWKRRIYFGTDFILKDVFANEDNWSPDAVKEMSWENNYKLGADILRIYKLYGLIGINNEGIDYYGFAFGLMIPGFSIPGFTISGIRSIEAMFQFVSIANPGSGLSEANANHITFFARTEFGKHREEAYIRK